MLAHRLLALLGVEVAAYAGVLLAAHRGALPWAVALGIVCGTHVALRCAAVPLGALVGARFDAARRPRLGPKLAASVYARECRVLWWHYVLAPFDPWLRAPGATDGARPLPAVRTPEVVLVHGILCNRVVWRPFQAALLRRGYPSRAVNMSPVLGSLDSMAIRLADELQRAASPLVVVAHSMGGLVTRRALQLQPTLPISALVTIGTPHRGAALAALVPAAAARAMRLGSRWLRELECGPPPPPRMRRVGIRSLHDELVAPTDSARWDGAANVVVDAVGHVALLGDPRVIDTVVAEIEAVAAECSAPVASREARVETVVVAGATIAGATRAGDAAGAVR